MVGCWRRSPSSCLRLRPQSISEDKYGRTPLSYAAMAGHEMVAKQLLKAQAAIDLKDQSGRTPLSLAAAAGHERIVKQLLEAKAEVGSQDLDGWTALSWASNQGHKAIV